MNVDDLVFKKEDEVIYTDEKTGLAFNLPNNKMITIYHEKDKVGMVKLKNNMSMNKGDMKKVVKRINTDSVTISKASSAILTISRWMKRSKNRV